MKSCKSYTYDQRDRFSKNLKSYGITKRIDMEKIAILCGEDYDWYMIQCVINNRVDKLGNKTFFTLMEKISEVTEVKIV